MNNGNKRTIYGLQHVETHALLIIKSVFECLYIFTAQNRRLVDSHQKSE